MSSHQPQQTGTGRPAHNKVAIPRQERRNDSPRKPATVRQNRVSRACLSCRSRKIRCNGVHPTCKNCAESSTSCVYASTRKDRLKIATEHNEEMMEFLKYLRTGVGDTEKKRIDEMLSGVSEDVADAASTFRKSQSSEMLNSDEVAGEANVSAEVGSNEDLDHMNEDILHDEKTRATGFLGKNTEVQWLRQLDRETENAAHGGSFDRPHGPPGHSANASAQRTEALKERQKQDHSTSLQTSEFSFYLDDEAIDMDFVVNSSELPSLDIADRLLRCYMETVQPYFPILAKKTFVNQFYHYYAALAQGAPYKVPRKWQATLNLVFAIGAAFSHLVESDWRADERDHFLYHARAWELSIKDPWWFSHPDLPQTQITGLLAIYYLAIGHTNRAWILTGMAIRFGFGLGLHIRNEDRNASVVKKELLSRTWWGLYTLECLLSVMTGRPSIGVQSHCSVYLPLPISCDDIEEARIKALFGENPSQPTHEKEFPLSETMSTPSSGMFNYERARCDPANVGTYLKCIIRIGQIQQRILTQLYSPHVVAESWKDVQEIILRINGELEIWAASIPPGLNFLSNGKEKPMTSEQNILLLHYRSTIILVNRPCLCRLDRRIPNQTQSSSDFNQRMALSCVSTAKDLSASLPDDMQNESAKVYELFPWWAVVHYIMQSLAILMLEISYDAVKGSDMSETISAMKKLVRWLRALRGNNGMARRAYTIVLDLLRKMASNTQLDISDLLLEDSAHNAPTDYDLTQAVGLYTQPFFSEEYLDRYSFPNAYADYSNPGVYQTNLFHTGHDQQNPFPFLGYVPMDDSPDNYRPSG
ncbi:unnamed protein product [Periconia digitata]|uniref:Zn(2)-C6 fungal-type domain-containing protein n=1 Tax=Periconia digitata TaxID=1303443 RepID=A0A9W4UJ72_9PLEO|nr:unnamed protein product [Periconia digitata]